LTDEGRTGQLSGIFEQISNSPGTGQAWTRDAKTFVMHEIGARSFNERRRLIKAATD